MASGSREITVRGARFWLGPEGAVASARLRRAGADAGPADVTVSFGRIGRDGKPAGESGSARFDPVRKRAIVEFERRRETIEAPSATGAIERFLAAHLLAGRIILLP